MFNCLSHSFPSVLNSYLQARLEPTRVKPLMGLHFDSRLLFFRAHMTLGYKSMDVANTPTYYAIATNSVMKSLS